MARLASILKANSKPKFSTRRQNRCTTCGRSKGVYKKFRLCRICFRSFSLQGLIPGIRKASW